MADKMMRSAGRGEDGTAKAISVNNKGDFINYPSYEIVRDYSSSIEIEAGNTESFGYVFVGDSNKLVINTYFNTSALHRVYIEEYTTAFEDGQTRNTKLINTITARNSDGLVTMNGNQTMEVILSPATNRLLIKIQNMSNASFTGTVFAYAGQENALSYFDDKDTFTFKPQKEIATEESIQKLTNLTEEGLNYSDNYKVIRDYSSESAEIEAGESWTSEYLHGLGNVNKLFLNTYFSSSQNHKVYIKEYTRATQEGNGKVTDLINTINVKHKNGSSVMYSNQNVEILLSEATNTIQVVVENISDTTFTCAIFAYAGKGDVLSYYDEEESRFKVQKEIATEETLADLIRTIKRDAVQTPVPTKPLLKNIQTIESGADQILWYHDGLFYANKMGTGGRKTLVTSPDGVEWTDVHTFTFENPASGIAKVLVGDFGNIMVGSVSGEVYISDEDGVFSNTPSFVTGKLSHRFGRFKHENVLGFTTYVVPQGFNEGQKHEAWLSTDNGKTYKKVFDNNTLQDLLARHNDYTDSRVHLHDIEYDPYSGRLYIWQGDFDSRTFYYSDDWGTTWEMAFPRGGANNITQLIAVRDGIVFGADNYGGGIGFLHLDRSSHIKPELNFSDYDNDYWRFNEDVGFIAGGKWVDRENDIYMIPYDLQFDDEGGESGFIAYSKGGKHWQILWKAPLMGRGTGIENVFYGNGLLVGTYKNVPEPYRTFIAEVDLK